MDLMEDFILDALLKSNQLLLDQWAGKACSALHAKKKFSWLFFYAAL